MNIDIFCICTLFYYKFIIFNCLSKEFTYLVNRRYVHGAMMPATHIILSLVMILHRIMFATGSSSSPLLVDREVLHLV